MPRYTATEKLRIVTFTLLLTSRCSSASALKRCENSSSAGVSISASPLSGAAVCDGCACVAGPLTFNSTSPSSPHPTKATDVGDGRTEEQPPLRARQSSASLRQGDGRGRASREQPPPNAHLPLTVLRPPRARPGSREPPFGIGRLRLFRLLRLRLLFASRVACTPKRHPASS